MKTNRLLTLLGIALLAFLIASCSKEDDASLNKTNYRPSGTPSTLEKDGLVLLLEKEKMQTDLYNWMNSQFRDDFFADMAQQDGRMMDKLSVLVDKYELDNPLYQTGEGEYISQLVQDYYDDIVLSTSGSIGLMINAAKKMESDLISELQDQQALFSGNDDIGRVYSDLVQLTESQLGSLITTENDLIYVYAPKDEIKDF